MDLTSLTGSIDYKPVVAAILAVGALKVGPILIEWASTKVMSFLKRG